MSAGCYRLGVIRIREGRNLDIRNVVALDGSEGAVVSGYIFWPRWSPDGQRFAVQRLERCKCTGQPVGAQPRGRASAVIP